MPLFPSTGSKTRALFSLLFLFLFLSSCYYFFLLLLLLLYAPSHSHSILVTDSSRALPPDDWSSGIICIRAWLSVDYYTWNSTGALAGSRLSATADLTSAASRAQLERDQLGASSITKRKSKISHRALQCRNRFCSPYLPLQSRRRHLVLLAHPSNCQSYCSPARPSLLHAHPSAFARPRAPDRTTVARLFPKRHVDNGSYVYDFFSSDLSFSSRILFSEP